MRKLKSIVVALISPTSSFSFAPRRIHSFSQFQKCADGIASRQTGHRMMTLFASQSGKSPPSKRRSTQSSKKKDQDSTVQRRRSVGSTTRSGLKRRTAGNPKPLQHSSKLLDPTVLFSNNHLLVVNKPAGYHSQPNESIEKKVSKKCLLSKLKENELGGGSAKNFLLPMHRLDQPCTGVLLLSKTSKAGTRTGNAFRKHLVQKDYFCVVEGDLDGMIGRSEIVRSRSGRHICKLSGVLMKGAGKSKGGRSVSFKPLTTSNSDQGRVCFLEWEHLLTVGGNRKAGRHLVRVVTSTGAKHQVRAMMSQIAKSPLCGDLRYGARQPLPDQSVALHARSLHIPTVSLGDMDLKSIWFVAPIPLTWSKFFSVKEKNIPKIKYT